MKSDEPAASAGAAPALFDPGWLGGAAAGPEPSRELYRSTLTRAHAAMVERFHAGAPAHVLVRRRADLVDHVLRRAWRQFHLDTEKGLALIAVGGYGRGELHPASDIDLLVLMRREPSPRQAEALEKFVAFLWDIGLEVGHSVRTLKQCVRLAKQDISVATNLMEARRLVGPPELLAALRKLTGGSKIWPSRKFFEGKQQERSKRHHRYHDTAYNLEPNVKEGPGGLRDLQMVGWVAKRHYDAETLHDLVGHGFLTESEYETLIEGQNFLWQVRFALHLIAERREDRLLFDYQRSLAQQFGYRDMDHNLGVEHFMKQYYRTIMELSRLNEMLLELFLEVILHADRNAKIEPLNRRFQVLNGYLEVTSENVFRRYPFALLEMFLLLQQNPSIKGVRASTIRLVRDHRYLIDDRFRDDLRCRSLFLEIIRQPRGITHEFRRMHTYGVLAAYLPVFGRIVGLMQYDLFHAYTVDEHTLFVVRNLRQFAVPEHRHELPHCSEVMDRIPRPHLVYLAGLLHDIAKGRGGDHSRLGAEEALAFCDRHGIGPFDARLVAWLVTNHLSMWQTAQREDITDPDVIDGFAKRVGDPVRLDYLYVLTVADITATNPDLWNEYKSALLRDLHELTRRSLSYGVAPPMALADLIRERQDTARRLLAERQVREDPSALWTSFGDDYFMRYGPHEIAWHAGEILRHAEGELPLVLVRPGRGGTEIFIFTEDRNLLFAATATVLERLGLTILDARIVTADNGMTLDCYVVQETDGTAIEGRDREVEIARTLRQRLQEPEHAIYATSRMPRRQLKHFPIPSQVLFSHDSLKNRTVMEVISPDRPGLLSRVGWALATCGASLHNAKIATFGERAEDTFFVTDSRGGPLAGAQCVYLRKKIVKALEPGRPRRSPPRPGLSDPAAGG